MSVSVNPEESNYIGLINESVHTSDDKDIGDVYAINKYFIVVKKGFINIHYYYIPLEKVEGWDGLVLWLKLSEQEVSKYERDVFPNPLRYYVKDFLYEATPPIVPSYNQIPRKFKTFAEVYTSDNRDEIDVYKCDLCGETSRDEVQYSKHISNNHY
ncbi:MAG: hypothetical protein AB7U98_08240 [Candidatus Nitrosocosmicus sp.]|jgi:hypothetical protein